MSNVDQSLEGVRSVGAVKWVDAGYRRLRGTAALQVAMTNVDQSLAWRASAPLAQ